VNSIPLNKKNLEDHLIETGPHFNIVEPLCAKFGLNLPRINAALHEKHAPKPDPLESMALFSMRRHKGWNYNIFRVKDSNLFAGIVFDQYRRPYYQTTSTPLIEEAVNQSRSIAELLWKGQCICFGFKLDEGKAIREKEENLQKSAAKTRRGGQKL
jgi:hypothetical protein